MQAGTAFRMSLVRVHANHPETGQFRHIPQQHFQNGFLLQGLCPEGLACTTHTGDKLGIGTQSSDMGEGDKDTGWHAGLIRLCGLLFRGEIQRGQRPCCDKQRLPKNRYRNGHHFWRTGPAFSAGAQAPPPCFLRFFRQGGGAPAGSLFCQAV